MPYQQNQQRICLLGNIGGKEDKIMPIYLQTKNMLIRAFLHAEFISAMKTVQIPTIFMKNAKK